MSPTGWKARGVHAPRSWRAAARLLFACAFLLAQGAERATAQDKRAATTPEPEVQRPLELGDVPDQLLQDREMLDKIKARSTPNEKLEALREPLVQLVEEIEAHHSGDLAEIERVRTNRALEVFAATWERRRAQISELERTLSNTGSALARDLGDLVALRARWEKVIDALQAAGASSVLLSGVNDMLARIDATRRDIEQRFQPIVEMDRQLTIARQETTRVEQGVADARHRLRVELFRIDSPPLWRAPVHVEGGYQTARENLQRSADLVVDYAHRNAVPLILFAVFGLAFPIALVLLHRSAAGWIKEDPDFAGAAGILARPVAGGALIVLMSGLLIVFRDVPGFAKALVGIALFLPMRRLLKLGILPGLQTSLYGIGVWFVVDMLRSLLMPEASLAARLLLLGESFGGIWLVRWLRRPSNLVHLGKAGLMMRAVGVALRFATPLLLISVVANLTGNVSLAELIDQGILLSLYLTYFVHAALGVLKAAFGTFLRTRTAQHSRMVRYHRSFLMERGERFLQFVSTLLWLAVTARVFLVDDLAYNAIAGVLTASFRIGQLDVSLGDFVLFGLMIWLSLVFSRVVRFVLEEDVLARASLPRGVPFAISTMLQYVFLVVGFLLAAAAAGVDIGRFTLVAGALGVGIGIGLQNVVNNFVSGLILLFERPIQLGDAVEVGPIKGTVRRIGLRSSTVRTYDGAEVVIPNSEFVSTQFVNWTLSDRSRRICLPIGVAYGTDPERVIELLLGVAKGVPKISPYPAPEVFFLRFGDSALAFELRVWISDFDESLPLQSALSVAVNTALREAGIEIPFPQRDLHVRSATPTRREGL